MKFRISNNFSENFQEIKSRFGKYKSPRGESSRHNSPQSSARISCSRARIGEHLRVDEYISGDKPSGNVVIMIKIWKEKLLCYM